MLAELLIGTIRNPGNLYLEERFSNIAAALRIIPKSQ